jgi:DNA repair exonuclease SbcCD ATPase subunit
MSDNTKSLEDRIEQLEEQLRRLNEDVLEGQLADWKARIDQLEVQARLGGMEAREQVDPVVERLRNRWLDAKEQFDKTQAAAGDAFASVRDGVKRAVDDLGDSLDEAVAKLRRKE